jgi:hypothetical protein
MAHSGSFLERQYCAFAGIARGQNSRDFVAALVARGLRHGDHPRQRPPRSDLPRPPQAALRSHRRAGRPAPEATGDRSDGATADDSRRRAGGSDLLVDGHGARQAQLLRLDAADPHLGIRVSAKSRSGADRRRPFGASQTSSRSASRRAASISMSFSIS